MRTGYNACVKRPAFTLSPGLRYMLAAAFFFSLMSLGVALAGRRLPSTMMVMARAVVGLVMSYGLLRMRGVSPWGTRRGLLVLRGVFGSTALLCFFYALTHLHIAEATVLQYLSPLFTALLAAVFLREAIGRVVAVGSVLCLMGIVFVARPAFVFGAADALDPAAVGIGVLGALASAGAYVTIRRIKLTEDPLVIVFYFPLVAVPATMPFVVAGWVWPSPHEWLLLVGLGVATQIAQVFMTRGLQLEAAGRATAVGYAQIVFATTWGVLFLGQVPHLGTLGGASLVILGCLLVALRRQEHQKEQQA